MDISLPHTIENTTGEKISFQRKIIRDGIEYIVGESEVQPNAGPPMHVHYRQDESMTVISGRLGYEIAGEAKKYVEAGETILFKAGVPHKFWNAGSDLLRCTAYISPPDNAVYFLSALFKSSNNNGGRPDMYDAAFLLTRYKSEYAMLEIPKLVQKLVFPLVLFVGTIMGKHNRFRDAPPPVK
jgi:mannose-6-phosphate isomerase-like protein (cupin superfamily)